MPDARNLCCLGGSPRIHSEPVLLVLLIGSISNLIPREWKRFIVGDGNLVFSRFPGRSIDALLAFFSFFPLILQNVVLPISTAS